MADEAPDVAALDNHSDSVSPIYHQVHMDPSRPLLVPTALSEDEPWSYACQDGDDDIARRVVWKIDKTIVPLLFVTYMLNFMDKIILSSAAVFGLREDTNLHGQQYSWISSIFYVGYFAWSYPTSHLISRLPTGKYLSANTIAWGASVALTAACRSFAGLLVVRFLLGVAEATVTPGFMFLTSTWYTRDEMPTRVGIWFAGNSFGGLCASVLAFGLGQVGTEDIHPWQLMYIVLGAATLFWAIPMFLYLPDCISQARFLTAKERRVAKRRVATAGTGITENTVWKREQMYECIVDPKTWFIVAIQLLTQIPNGGAQSFANIVVQSFGFTNLQSTLINIPYSLLSASFISGFGYLAGRFRTMTCLLIVAAIAPCVIGCAIIYHRARVPQPVHLYAYFLLSSGSASMPLNMALVQANYRGVTKKATITAMLFMAYCLGNLAGPHFFREREAPNYETAFASIMVCYSLAIVSVVILRIYLQRLNAKRTAEGFAGSAGGAGAGALNKLGQNTEVEASVDGHQDGEDLTDWQTRGFRYRL